MVVNPKYEIGGFNMVAVRNRNETRVVECMRGIINATKNFCGCQLCLEDVYALSLNGLSPHYVQSGAIVLGGKTAADKELIKAVKNSIKAIKKNPNHD